MAPSVWFRPEKHDDFGRVGACGEQFRQRPLAHPSREGGQIDSIEKRRKFRRKTRRVSRVAQKPAPIKQAEETKLRGNALFAPLARSNLAGLADDLSAG